MPEHPLGQNTKESTKCLVPTARLELAQLSPLPPQDSVSTNFTTSAAYQFRVRNLAFGLHEDSLTEQPLILTQSTGVRGLAARGDSAFTSSGSRRRPRRAARQPTQAPMLSAPPPCRESAPHPRRPRWPQAPPSRSDRARCRQVRRSG